MSEASAMVIQLSVLMPAFNEEDLIADAIHAVLDCPEFVSMTMEVIVISDGSIDATAQVASGISDSRLVVIDLAQNQGKGGALREGFHHAHGEVVAFFDADLDISMDSLVGLINLLEVSGADVAIGSKTHPESLVNFPTLRRFQSHTFRFVIKTLFQFPFADTQTGVKVFRRQVLDETLPIMKSSRFEFDVELLGLASASGFQVVEGPVHIQRLSSSRVRKLDAVRMLVNTLKIKRRISRLNSTSTS